MGIHSNIRSTGHRRRSLDGLPILKGRQRHSFAGRLARCGAIAFLALGGCKQNDFNDPVIEGYLKALDNKQDREYIEWLGSLNDSMPDLSPNGADWLTQ